jgi:hypothetical protein
MAREYQKLAVDGEHEMEPIAFYEWTAASIVLGTVGMLLKGT